MALQLDRMQPTTGTRPGTRLLNLQQRWLEHPRFPAMLAFGAVLVMLPSSKLGLLEDDLPQRMIALPPNRHPKIVHPKFPTETAPVVKTSPTHSTSSCGTAAGRNSTDCVSSL